jgi:hypothetical protein
MWRRGGTGDGLINALAVSLRPGDRAWKSPPFLTAIFDPVARRGASRPLLFGWAPRANLVDAGALVAELPVRSLLLELLGNPPEYLGAGPVDDTVIGAEVPVPESVAGIPVFVAPAIPQLGEPNLLMASYRAQKSSWRGGSLAHLVHQCGTSAIDLAKWNVSRWRNGGPPSW